MLLHLWAFTFVKINGINVYYRSNIMAEKDKIKKYNMKVEKYPVINLINTADNIIT